MNYVRIKQGIVAILLSATSAQGADVAIRVYHPHEVKNLIEADRQDYPVTYQSVDLLQYNIEQHDEALAAQVAQSLKTNRITEEWIIKGDIEKATEQSYNGLVKRIEMAERNGWSWGDIICYREPSFDFAHPKQKLRPGPWNDLRILCADDIETMRAQLKAAHTAGRIKQDNYKLCQLIYSWKNIGEPEKAFLLKHFDGVYVELNTRRGNWVVDGIPGQVTKANYDLETYYKIADFGDPGMTDCADMAKWCMENDFHFGITMGSNLRDIWFKDMFEEFMKQMKKRGVDPADPRITYVMHHNRGKDDGVMPYFPESEEASMTDLTKYLIHNVGQLAK